MEEFKINNINITNVCREVKEELNKSGTYHELAIMYDTIEEKFIIASTSKVQQMEFEGYYHYCNIARSGLDKKKTIKGLKKEIFNL